MNIFLIVLFICIVVGIILVTVGLIAFVNKKDSGVVASEDTIKEMERSVAEADNAINEMNKMAEAIFKEIENKYQELLFLYSLIDEKKKDISDIYSKPDIRVAPPVPSPIKEEKIRTVNNPKFDKIMELVNQGMQLSDIAKKLNMGQGEIKMILELGKAR